MLGPRLLLLLSCGGALLSAGLDDSSLVPPGLRRLKDSPQTAPDRGWCSTWGPGHFATFDGHTYDFSGTCNYIFAAMCKDASSTFSVQLRRGPSGNISRVIVELGASVVTMQKAAISVKDVGVVSLPYTSNGLQITPFGQSVRLVAKQLELEPVVMWGPGAHLMVLVEKKHMGKMCGLCGNYDGEKANEFLSEDGQLLEPPKYAALQKLDDPNEICAYEAIPSPRVPQAEDAQTCIQLLTLVSRECNVPKEPFPLSCQADMAMCAQPGRHHCSCATLSEYSRQCSMAGQPVNSWRGPGLCPVGQCPANQVYRECGETCVRTCSNPRHSCSSFCTFGCVCPEGMVLDDISKNHSCVPVPQCPCVLSGVAFAPGEVTTAACQTCRCSGGRWECVEQPCPRRCALEGGSFVTTFDARPYRFHGTCTYILLQSPQLPDGGSLMAVYDKSGYSHSETSLVAVIYVSSQDKIVISQDEVITNNGETKRLPYETRNITIFRQTSTHMQMVTTFGLELVIQLWPLFQVYITVGPQFRGQTRGLCGNFNGDTTDDFMTSMGIAEGTASLFVDSWRAGNCPAAREREIDPCSMSQLNKVCAETHCAVLVRKGTVFEKCHAAVDPKPFYKRCVYQACNYEETFPHICAALGDYALACTSRGVLLQGWRSSVDNCSTPCTGNQTFSYNSQACDRTCLSLSNREVECHPSAVPVDGCNCPEGTYLNHKTECVREAQCPCLLDSSKFILAGQSTMVNGVICHCVNGRLSCPAQPQTVLATCSAPKTFQSCSQSSEDKFGAACAPTCQMLATGTPCVPTKCEPGCVCAKGLYENASGQCVPPEECPCEFAGISYPQGADLHTDCKSCICSRGTWTCQQSAHCPSTCTLYGEGHVVTFDGQRFVFDGNCEYILATDSCGASDSQPTFKILTENVVCGKSGVTCSRAIKIFLGGLSFMLADRNYTVRGEDPGVHFRVEASSLHLVLDATISSTYNLTLIWNKHMTVFIKIARASQDALCGLCGNYNGDMKDDFQTRSKYLAPSELEFVNSWKESPLCADTTFTLDPCSLNTFRHSWAERKCSIINSQTFAACHSQVYRLPYYEACVRDTCGCDTGGDCECLCDAVAAYAKACVDKGVCVDWRSPDFCPIYCDFYNTHTQVGGSKYQYTQETNCTWHYQPCLCPAWPQSFPGTNIEGCYNCSQNEYFDHDKGTCLPCNTQPSGHANGHSHSRHHPDTTNSPPRRIASNHLHRHHMGHISASHHGHSKANSHGTHRDPGHNAAHRILPRHSHAVHSSVHGANHSSPANITDPHSVPRKNRAYTHSPATDQDHNRDCHTHSLATDKNHNRDRQTHSPATDKDHNRDRHTHNPATDKEHNRHCHNHSPATDKDHNRDHHTHSPATDKDHNRDHHTQNPTTDKDHNRDRHTHSPATDKDHNRDHHTQNPTTDKDHNRDRHTHSHTTDKDHNRDYRTHSPATDQDHNRDRHTHSHTTDKDHNRDYRTHSPATDQDHNRDRHTHSHTTDKDHNRDYRTHSPATDQDHNRDRHTHSPTTDRDHNRDRHTQNPATDKDHDRGHASPELANWPPTHINTHPCHRNRAYTHSPATDKDHNRNHHTHSPATDKDHNRDHHTPSHTTDKDHNRNRHTHSPAADKDHNRDLHTQNPATDKGHKRDRHTHSPTTDKDHNRNHHTQNPATDKDHKRDHHTHSPATDKDHNRDPHTQNPATDKDHNRDLHTQNPATDKDHKRDRHTHSHTTDKDHNRNHHTQNPATDKDHKRDHHTHSPATDKDHNRDHHTQNPATDKDHDRGHASPELANWHPTHINTHPCHRNRAYTHSPATDKDHNRNHHTQNPATDKDHNRDHHTPSHTTDKDHNRNRHTHSPAADKDHNRDLHTQNPATDKDHKRDRHTHSPTTDKDHNRNHHTQNPATDKDHKRDHHTHSPATDKDHNRDQHTHSHTTDKDHNRDHHTHSPATDKDHNRDHHTPSHTTDKDHNRDRQTHSPATDKDHNRNRHTHSPAADKDHNRDLHTQNPATDKDHNRNRHTHSPAADKDHNRDLHTQNPATDKDHKRDRHTHRQTTDKDHNRDYRTHSPATDQDLNRDHRTHSPTTDRDHNRDHHTQNPATDKDHDRGHTSPELGQHSRNLHCPGITLYFKCPPSNWHPTHINTHPCHRNRAYTHSPATDKDHNRNHHTQNPATDKDHKRDRRTHSPATDKDHNRDHHTPSHTTDKDHNRNRHTHSPAADKDHNRDLHTQNPATDKGHKRDRHTHSPTTDKDHNRDHPSPELSQHTTIVSVRPSLSPPSSPTLSPLPTPSTMVLSTSRTTASKPTSSALSSRSTTSKSTSLTTRAPTQGLLSSTLGVTAIPNSPATNLTTRQPSTTRLPASVFLTGSITAHGSSSFPTARSSSTRGQSISSLITSLPSSPGTCSVREFEEEVTYQGCTANVTVTRCEGVCASSASFNTDTMQVDTNCSCCHPLSSHEKQLVLPCPDPRVRGRRLTLRLQVFSSCTCRSQRCGD
ncbi:PREDICTED: mucin-6 [Lipotes vexillifer]|uniref:Mucin-6 n=1 Tax=Lipotes vexillifer TaxID=118797 RepID=A0A340XY33_LIPVE|nr:PREDICTED: mucin-6 [Lipotes vexillifer]